MTRVLPVLTWLRSHPDPGAGESGPLGRFLAQELPRWCDRDPREQHEVAWALGDLYERARQDAEAALCRSAATHERLAVVAWVHSFDGVRAPFWAPALASYERGPRVPTRARLSLSSAHALLVAVGTGDGVRLTDAGRLPPALVVALDDRFRWTEEFPWMRSGGEDGIAPLQFLHEHLVAQRLLVREGDRLVRSALGTTCVRDTGMLWRTVVDPSPRWTGDFERDALGVMAASVLRSSDFALGRIAEALTQVLAAKWRPARPGGLFDGASSVVQSWYQVGVPLGWWDTGRGPADRRPNVFGAAAAAAVFRAVAGPAVRG